MRKSNFSGQLTYRLSFYFLMIWVIISLLAPLIANEKEVILVSSNGISLPFLSDKQSNEGKVYFRLKAPIPYSPGSLDLDNSNHVSPFSTQEVTSTYHRHWLGTDQLGRDVLSNLIHGSKTAFLVGFLSMLIAGFIGLFLGILAALLGDHLLKIKQHHFFLLLFHLILFLLFLEIIPFEIQTISFTVKFISLIFSILILFGSFYLFNTIFEKKLKKNSYKFISLPVDLLIGRLIEIVEATPLLFLIVAFTAIFEPSFYSIIIIIGITGWVGIAKFARAESLKIIEMEYIESGKALGFSTLRILFKHILPNAIGPIATALSFGIAAAILIEATLSFIGLGLSASDASWGSLLAESRLNYRAWWLAVFPGLAIFLSVFSCHVIGEKLSK